MKFPSVLGRASMPGLLSQARMAASLWESRIVLSLRYTGTNQPTAQQPLHHTSNIFLPFSSLPFFFSLSFNFIRRELSQCFLLCFPLVFLPYIHIIMIRSILRQQARRAAFTVSFCLLLFLRLNSQQSISSTMMCQHIQQSWYHQLWNWTSRLRPLTPLNTIWILLQLTVNVATFT